MTKRLLLISDDYSELMKMQADFKKIGFDVQTAGADVRLQDQLITFAADAVVVLGRGNRNLAFALGEKLKELSKFQGKVILVVPMGLRPQARELSKVRMDLLLEDPAPREKLVQGVARVLSLDAQPLLSKLLRGVAQVESTLSESERAQKYAPFLQLKIDKAQSSHSKQQIKEAQANLKKGWDFKFLATIDDLKREFVRALMKKSA